MIRFTVRIDEPRWVVWTSPLDWVSACRVAAMHQRCGCPASVRVTSRQVARLFRELLATAPREDQGTMAIRGATCRYVKVWKAEALPTADQAAAVPGQEPLPPQHEPEEWDLDDVVGLPDVPPGKEAS